MKPHLSGAPTRYACHPPESVGIGKVVAELWTRWVEHRCNRALECNYVQGSLFK